MSQEGCLQRALYCLAVVTLIEVFFSLFLARARYIRFQGYYLAALHHRTLIDRFLFVNIYYLRIHAHALRRSWHFCHERVLLFHGPKAGRRLSPFSRKAILEKPLGADQGRKNTEEV